MYEVYSRQHEKVHKKVYFSNEPAVIDNDNMSYQITDAAGEIIDSGAVASVDGKYEVVIPPLPPSTLTIEWDYFINNIPIVEKEKVWVVEPYVRIPEIYEYHPDLGNRPLNELKDMERRVRYVINTFCGQSFSLTPNSRVTAWGYDSDVLQLPFRVDRLIGLHSPRLQTGGNFSIPPGGGWKVTYTGPHGIYRYRDIKADVGPGMGVESVSPYFRSGIQYTVFGDFGWREVPVMINQAARLLVADYFELEAEWRRKNIDVIRAADWRFEQASSPISTTGNIDADLILSNYIAPGIVLL